MLLAAFSIGDAVVLSAAIITVMGSVTVAILKFVPARPPANFAGPSATFSHSIDKRVTHMEKLVKKVEIEQAKATERSRYIKETLDRVMRTLDELDKKMDKVLSGESA